MIPMTVETVMITVAVIFETVVITVAVTIETVVITVKTCCHCAQTSCLHAG